MKIVKILLPGMRRITFFSLLLFGMFFLFSSHASADSLTSCQDRLSAGDPVISGQCKQPINCAGLVGGTSSCTATGEKCCLSLTVDSSSGSTITPVGCPDDFEPRGGVCFPRAGTVGLGDISVFALLQRVLNWLLGIFGVLSVLAFVISGTQYLVSAGDEQMVETAKNNMKYAIIGLVVALSGLIIVNAVAGLTGAGGVTSF